MPQTPCEECVRHNADDEVRIQERQLADQSARRQHTNTLRTNGRNGSNDFSELESVKDGGLTGSIESDLSIAKEVSQGYGTRKIACNGKKSLFVALWRTIRMRTSEEPK